MKRKRKDKGKKGKKGEMRWGRTERKEVGREGGLISTL